MTQQASGADLARQALANYKATAAASPARGTRGDRTPGRRRMAAPSTSHDRREF